MLTRSNSREFLLDYVLVITKDDMYRLKAASIFVNERIAEEDMMTKETKKYTLFLVGM